MSKRIYCLLDSCQDGEAAYQALLLAEIPKSSIHCLARDGQCLNSLPPAGILQKTDLLHGLWRGLVCGGISGTAAGLFVAFNYPQMEWFGFGTVLMMSLVGAVFGAWASSLIAISVPSSRLRAFQAQIDAGKVLFIIDIPESRVDGILKLLDAHPRTQQVGRDNTVPAFP